MCFTAQNRSYIVMLLEHFMNLKSFIWNWSLNDFFYLPSLLAIPFKCLNENKEGQGCHTSRFQWTPWHLKVQRTDSITGIREAVLQRTAGRVPPVDWPWWWLDGTQRGLVQSHVCFTLGPARLLGGGQLWFLWLRQINPNEWLLPNTKNLVSLDQSQYFCALRFLLMTKIHVYSWNCKVITIE